MRATGLLLVVALVGGCSSGSGGGGGSSGSGSGTQVACVTTSGNGAQGCTILKDLSAAAESDATKNCQGTVANDCPTAQLVGCCNIAPQTSGQVPQEICFYTGTTSSLQSTCGTALHGSWSATQ
jgi:hypothetical protein